MALFPQISNKLTHAHYALQQQKNETKVSFHIYDRGFAFLTYNCLIISQLKIFP
jgi:hypothetical protein